MERKILSQLMPLPTECEAKWTCSPKIEINIMLRRFRFLNVFFSSFNTAEKSYRWKKTVSLWYERFHTRWNTGLVSNELDPQYGLFISTPVYTFEGNLERYENIIFVESVKRSCISLAEKLHVNFDGMKGISRPLRCELAK